MKYFYIILSICFFFLSSHTYASTLSWDLLEIQNKIGTWYVNDYYKSVPYYDISKLDQDILRKKSDWENSEAGLPKNSIQQLSKEKWWKKQNFLDFVNALKVKDTKKAVRIYEKYSDTISPFLPTCCTFGSYIAHKPMRNGILSLFISGQDWVNYILSYTFYKKWVLYEIELETGFASNIDKDYKYLFYNTGWVYDFEKPIDKTKLRTKFSNTSFFNDFYNETLKSWFTTPSKNAIFEKKYNRFVSDMSKIWKQ